MARFMIAVTNERTLGTFPLAEGVGCVRPGEHDCCGESGSGSGTACDAACVYTSAQCPGGVSGEWTFPDPADATRTVGLCYVRDPADGNFSRWLSDDLSWELGYDEASAAWVLDNLDTGELWAAAGESWNCTAANTLASAEGNAAVTVTPTNICDAPQIYCMSSEPTPAPARLTLSFHDCTADLAFLNGTSVDMTYDGVQYWQPATIPTGWTTFRLSLVAPGDSGTMPTFLMEFRGCVDYDNGISPNTCAPFSMPGGGTIGVGGGTCVSAAESVLVYTIAEA